MHPNFHSGTIYSNQDMEASYVSIDREMDKDVYINKDKHTNIHTQRILLSHNKLHSDTYRNIDGARDFDTEWSKSDMNR